MRPHEAAALAAVRAVYAEPVYYSGSAFEADDVPAIRSEVGGEEFQGRGSTLRQVSYEIAFAALPAAFRPRKEHRIVDATGSWKVQEARRDETIAAWVLIVIETQS